SSVLARGAYVIAPLFPQLLSQLLEVTTGLHVALELIAVVDEENFGRDQKRASAVTDSGCERCLKVVFAVDPHCDDTKAVGKKPGRYAFKKQNPVLENLASGDDSFRYSCRSRPVPHFDVFASLASAALSAARAPARMVAIE